MDETSLQKRYQDGRRDFSWADLQGVNLTAAQLPAINLYRANLAGANLAGADLTGANLFKANLAGANLTNVQLSGANLRKADLREAQFDPAQLQQADLRGAILAEEFANLLLEPKPSEVEPSLSKPAALEDQAVPRLAEPESSAETDAIAPAAPWVPPNRIDQRELGISLATLGFGFGCYGFVLGNVQSLWWLGWLVWLPVWLGLWQEDLVWYVPVMSAVGVVLGVGVSLGALIFIALATVALLAVFGLYSSSAGWGAGKTLGTALWFSSIVFVAMHISLWLFDGSQAYSGGGIVLNLAMFQVALLLIVGVVGVGRGAIAYIQLDYGRYPQRLRRIYISGSSALGLVLGQLIGRGG